MIRMWYHGSLAMDFRQGMLEIFQGVVDTAQLLFWGRGKCSPFLARGTDLGTAGDLVWRYVEVLGGAQVTGFHLVDA